MGLEERPLLLSIVRTLATSLRVPLFCKIRLQDELQDTLTYCRQLREAPLGLGLGLHCRLGAALWARV